MKYADVDIKTARKCCKQHSYKRKDGQTINKCETCPLERTKDDHHYFCWYVLMRFNKWCRENMKDYSEEQYLTCNLNEEYNALKDEEINKTLEWENWILSQESLD